MQGDAEPVTPPTTTTPANDVESASEHKRKKKKKKRKTENNDAEKVKERECILSHLDTSNQDEDWCQGGIWSLTSHPDTERSKQKHQLAATIPTQCESDQKEQGRDSVKLKKKKKKIKLMEALQDTTSTNPDLEMWVELYDSNFIPPYIVQKVLPIITSWFKYLNCQILLENPTMQLVCYMPTFYERNNCFSISTFHIFLYFLYLMNLFYK